MALELPGWLVTAFNVVGLPWPGIDEDQLRAWARSVRAFADGITASSARTHHSVAGLADTSQSAFMDALAARSEHHNQLVADLHGPMNDFADALDVAADVVVAQKWAVIGAASALAGEFVGTQIGAIFTLGADEAALPEEIISTRELVKAALEYLEAELIGKLTGIAAQAISDHVSRFLANFLLGDALPVAMEVQSLKLTYDSMRQTARAIRGHAAETEDIGTTAYGENADRDIEDPGEGGDAGGDGGRWAAVVQAVKQCLFNIAASLFKDLPKAIADDQHADAAAVDTFANRMVNLDKSLGDGAPHEDGTGAPVESGARPAPSGPGEPALVGGSKTSGGQASEGNGSTCTGGDPVDIVSGQMLATAVDLELPAVLPLVLRRAYASGYHAGHLFGPGWSSTLDQRIQIDDHGIRFAGDDAQILHYPVPAQDDQHVLPVAGARWPLSWDRATDTICIEDPGRGWTWQFDAATAGRRPASRETRHLARITDRNGNTIGIRRDAGGLPVEVVHSGGYRVAVDCSRTDEGPRVVGLRLLDAGDQQGAEILRYGYDSPGRLIELTDFTGIPYTYEYDESNRITAWIDRAGYRYQYDYDQSGRVVRGTGDGGFLSASFDYDTDQRVTVVTNSLGHAIAHHYDEHGHLTRVIAPDGGTVTTEFDRYGRMLSHTDELGRATRFVLDGNGDPVRSVDADGNVTEIRYSDLRMVTSIAYGGMTRAEFAYDERGNLLAETDAAGAVTRYEYDDRGGTISATDALGNRTVIERNQAGLITSATDALGRASRVVRNRFGDVVEFTDAHGASTLLARRPDGLLIEKIAPDGSREQWERDAAGRVIEHLDETGARTRFEAGPFDRMLARTQPDGTRFEFAYDTEFRLTAVTSDGTSWTYEYDPAGRLVSEEDFNGRRQRYERDAAGQLLELTGADGRSTRFAYNSAGDITERRSHGDTVTTFDYDAAGFLRATTNAQCTVEYTRDHAGRVLAETVNGRTLTYEYDLLGRCTRRVTPTGIVSEWTYDATDHPLTLAATAGSLAFEYDDLGREITRHLGGGMILTQSWDTGQRLTGQSLLASDAGRVPASSLDWRNVSNRTYSYAANGLVSEITDSASGRRAITMTPAGRVAEVSSESWTERYVYDSFGNITHAETALGTGSPQAEDRVYAGTLLRHAGGRSYDYDDRGRLTRMRTRTLSGKLREWHYTWDDDDQLTQVATPDRGTWAYRYDPLGRRIAKQRLDDARGAGQSHATEYVEFTWDETRIAEQVSVRADGSRHAITWDWDPGTWRAATQTERSWTAGDDQAEIDRRFFAIVTDLTGGPDQLVATDGQVIRTPDADIWGQRQTADEAPGSCPLGMPGQYRDDETGLDYNYFRYYDSQTGRYLTGDPLGLEPSPNPHAYVINPLAWIDPLGLGSQSGQVGGHYGPMAPSNPAGMPLNSYERNHIPAKDSWLQLGLAHSLSIKDGPAIRMEYNDHRNFISTGRGIASQDWRAEQADLIKQGKFDEAMKKDIDEIRRVHGTKYNAAIKQMVDDMPNNKGLQDFLKKNGWKIRSCLLQ